LLRMREARYIGEFAARFNPYILTQPMRDILFDEKIGGRFLSFKLARRYEKADNGQPKSSQGTSLRFSASRIRRREIYFDDQLVRQRGLFVRQRATGSNTEYVSELRAVIAAGKRLIGSVGIISRLADTVTR